MKACLILAFLFLSSCFQAPAASHEAAGLRHNFYGKSCPCAEDTVRNITWAHVSKNSALPAKFLRMQFHDCFVRGCDASILLNSTANSKAEKDAAPNLSLSGFDVIDEANANIPSPLSNFSTLLQNFSSKGLGLEDLVVLSGAHTIGVGHCNLFSKRLYNFTGKGDADPSLDSTYAAFLRTQCKGPSDNATVVAMDPLTPLSFDNRYFAAVQQHRGLFQSDAALLTDAESQRVVKEMVKGPHKFFAHFAHSIKKMGSVGVLTGNAGEIRKKCYVVNS
ncbi:Peroxidase 27 [Nymphaea thermarum]|nr:Peroxidase 27 [Nymphaea thermarum]